MAEFPLYATGVVMALFLVAIVAAMLRMRRWKDYEPAGERETAGGAVLNFARSDEGWMVGFLLAALGVGFGAVLLAGGDMAAVDEGLLETVVLGGLGGLVVLFVFLGTYFAVVERGGASSRGAALGTLLLGVLLLTVIALQLLGVV